MTFLIWKFLKRKKIHLTMFNYGTILQSIKKVLILKLIKF